MVNTFYNRIAVAAALVASALALQGCFLFSGRPDNDGFTSGFFDKPAEQPMLPTEVEAAQQAAAQAAPVQDEVAQGEAAPAAEVSKAPETMQFETDELKAAANRKFEPLVSAGYRIRVIVMIGDKAEVGPLEVQVSEKEDIMLPLVGRVHCGGMTIIALHSLLADRYSEFFNEAPEVTVSFIYSDDGISPYGQVYVYGRVKKEGWINIPPTRNLRLTHAIQRAGGFATSALRGKVKVTRKGVNGEEDRVREVNFKDVGKRGALDQDIILEPFDVIYVDESNF